MPGFSEGMANISRDEQRHIGFGVKVLSELLRESDECKAAVDELLAEVLPWTSSVFIPPNWDREYTRCYGFELEDIASWGMQAIEQKWRAIGYPMEEMPPGVIPMDLTQPPRERAERLIRLVQSGAVGEPGIPADSSRETQELYFDLVRRSVDTSATGGQPFTVQWRFADAEDWHLVVDNGSTRAEPGLLPGADVTLESSWQDFIELGKGGVSGPKALLQRRLRLHGGPRNLLRFRRLLAA
jgi:hypothetical protein